MKFTPRTIQILRNFANINQSLIFKEGDRIATIALSKTIMAKAKLDTKISRTFAIYDLPKFLAALSMFEDPEIELGENSLQIKTAKETLNYIYSEPSLVLVPPDKVITLPSVEVEFELKADVLSRTIKALSIIGAPVLAVTGNGKNVYLEALDTKNSSKSNYSVEVGKTDKVFQANFLAENIKVMLVDYNVSISAKGLAHFQGNDIEYWIAVEDSSKFR